MWLFDKRGFISVVAYDPKKDLNSKSVFRKFARKAGSHLLVRARIEEDLDMLKSVVPNLVVETDKGADYSFRCVVTRKQYKRFLAEAVDGITYDSHFKEAARDASPKAKGRYEAMMGVWSKMASLQPYSPYGGYTGGYMGGYGGGYGSTYGGSGKSTPVAVPTTQKKSRGVDSVAEFLSMLDTDETDLDAYRFAEGPRTGFEEGDFVTGFFGTEGVVTAVNSREKQADLVQVEYVEKGQKVKRTFLSNFLVPVIDNGDPETEPGEDDEAEFVGEASLDPDWLIDYLRDNPDVSEFPLGYLSMLNDEAYEVLHRLEDESMADESSILSREQIENVVEEVRWEFADNEERRQMASDGAVPERYVSDAIAADLFSELA